MAQKLRAVKKFSAATRGTNRGIKGRAIMTFFSAAKVVALSAIIARPVSPVAGEWSKWSWKKLLQVTLRMGR